MSISRCVAKASLCHRGRQCACRHHMHHTALTPPAIHKSGKLPALHNWPPSEVLTSQNSSISMSISATVYSQAVTFMAEGVIGAVSQAEPARNAKWGCS